MRRPLYIVLVAAAVLMLGVRFLTPSDSSPDVPRVREISFVEYSPAPLVPVAERSLGQLQNLVDRVGEFALKGQWQSAAKTTEDLKKLWSRLRLETTNSLEIEKSITNSIAELERRVWEQDRQQVLGAARKLTSLIGQLNSSN